MPEQHRTSENILAVNVQGGKQMVQWDQLDSLSYQLLQACQYIEKFVSSSGAFFFPVE